jgi:hypothetical protein
VLVLKKFSFAVEDVAISCRVVAIAILIVLVMRGYLSDVNMIVLYFSSYKRGR